jgi:hypothetical protein
LKEETMSQDPERTRTEEELSAAQNLRNAMIWRVKVQLRNLPSVTADQYEKIVGLALHEAQWAAQELSNLYAAVASFQGAGWRPFDCFDQAAAQAARQAPPAAQEPTGPPPPASQAQPPKGELDDLGRDLQKGLKEVGGALQDFFGSKKK